MNSPESQQERILRTFTALSCLRNDWGGALILAIGLNPQGAALAFASNITGAVCLSLEDDPARIKEAIRSGACDFIVNTLDEALRTIKNEIRKHSPLSVGLHADTHLILQQLMERGVSPEIFTVMSSHQASSESAIHFRSLGASILNFDGNHATQPAIHVPAVLEAFLHLRQWRLQSFTFETSSALRAFDTGALANLSPDDKLRRSWLRASPKIVQRERPYRRLLWLTDEERRTHQK
jgi:hypothetical protein